MIALAGLFIGLAALAFLAQIAQHAARTGRAIHAQEEYMRQRHLRETQPEKQKLRLLQGGKR